jgi:hypothetical protein
MAQTLERETQRNKGRIATNVVRGALAATGAVTLSVFGPDAARAISDLGHTRGQRSALSDATSDAAKATEDLSFKAPPTRTVRGHEFKLGSPPPNPEDAVGTLRHGREKLGEAGAPQEVVEGFRNIEGLIGSASSEQGRSIDFPVTKQMIVDESMRLNPYARSLQTRQDRLEVEAAVNTALAVAPIVVLFAGEKVRKIHRKRQKSTAGRTKIPALR